MSSPPRCRRHPKISRSASWPPSQPCWRSRRDGGRCRCLRPRDDRGDQRAARGPRRAHRAGRHRRLPGRRRARPPGRADLYRLCAARPAPLVPPCAALRRPERMGPDGVLEPLARRRRAGRRCRRLRAAGGRGLPAARRPPPRPRARDRRARCASALGDDVAISLSHEVVGTFREYERAATTEVDAALTPLLRAYLRAPARPRAATPGSPSRGSCSPAAASPTSSSRPRHAALTVLSGPAGGAAAAALIAAPCRRAQPPVLRHGRHVVRRVGRRRRRGARTSPGARSAAGRWRCRWSTSTRSAPAAARSRGATPAARCASGRCPPGPCPGPACYGRGGVEATVTDAHIVLRPPRPGAAAGRRRRARRATPRTRRSRKLADALGLSTDECARGIVRVADAEMVRALRVMTVERGLDPRDFALLAFGGAGALHAAAIADELGIARVLVPAASGVLSALGLAAAQRRVHVQRTVLRAGDELDDALLQALRDELATQLPARAAAARDRRPGALPRPVARARRRCRRRRRRAARGIRRAHERALRLPRRRRDRARHRARHGSRRRPADRAARPRRRRARSTAPPWSTSATRRCSSPTGWCARPGAARRRTSWSARR